MKELQITMDSKYLFVENRIFSFEKDRLISENEQTLEFWLNLLKENTIFAAQNDKIDLSEINKMVKSVAYEISEKFVKLSKVDFIYEFERRFGFGLLQESFNKDAFVRKLNETWDFITNKIQEYGLIYESDINSKILSFMKNKMSPLIEKGRDALFSLWGGVAQTAVTYLFPGIGAAGVATVWGLFLFYDIYMAINGEPNYLNIFFDIISFLPAASFAKKGFSAIKASSAATNTAEGALSAITKEIPQTKGLFGTLSKWAAKITEGIKSAAKWLSKKTGIKAFENIADACVNFFKKISEKASKFAKQTISNAPKAGKESAIDYAIGKGDEEFGIISKPLGTAINTGVQAYDYIKNMVKNK